MRADQAFWAVLVAVGLVWYAGVTVYVAIRGVRDIRDMIRRLDEHERSPKRVDRPGR